MVCVNSNVTITKAGVTCKGAVKLILVDGYTLNITGASGVVENNAGICVSGNENSLTIYGQTAGTGTLIAKGGYSCGNASGIGGGCKGSTRGDASNIYVKQSMTLVAGSSASSTQTITNTGGDLASTLAGKTYVKAEAYVPQTYTVTTETDSGEGSLRQAIANVNDGDIIRFADSVRTITLTSTLEINCDVTIDSSSLNGGITIDGAGQYRIFTIGNAAQTKATAPKVEMKGLTLKNGSDGAIYANVGTSLTLSNCVLTDNNANNHGSMVPQFVRE